MADAQDSGHKSEWSPPYVPFKTLLNLIVKMEEEGVPNRIDKSFLSYLSGGTQSHVWASMRSLGLIDENRVPTQLLSDLVKAGDSRPQMFRQLLEDKFSWATSLGSAATHLELVEAFTSHSPNLGTPTRDKALSFYLAAASYAGLPLSKWFKSKPGAGSSSRRTTTRRPKPAVKPDAANPKPRGTRRKDQTPATDETRRQQYFELLLAKAQASDTADTGLLDRIERLIGLEEVTTP
jgi:Family of unknown function (DUF5343)